MLPLPDLSRPPTDGRRLYNPSGGFLEFSYDLGPYGQAPEDPAEVLQTAIEAYHRGDFPGRYELVTVGEYFHIVPTARRDEGGVWEPDSESPRYDSQPGRA